MRYKLLGNSGLRISELCLGTMTFGEDWGWGASFDECKTIYEAFREAGGNFIDSANIYTNGTSEKYVGELIASEREAIVVATKYSNGMPSNDPNGAGNHRKRMMQSVEGSLKRLKTDYIDLLWVHAWDFTTPPEEVMRSFDDLVRQGALDLGSLASIRQFVQNFIAGERPPLQAIVCNAGIQIVSDTFYTKDGFEMTFGVNHLGHFLLVNLLLPRLSDRSRIVFVSSDTHNPNTNTGMPHPRYKDAKLLAFPAANDNGVNVGNTGRERYTTSKLCNILCAYELSRRLQKQHSNITVNAFNPGLMLDTKLSRDYSESELAALITTTSRSVLEKARDSQTMGSALSKLILDPSLFRATGKYFDGLEEVQSSDESYDRKKATELWQSSAELVKLSSREAPLMQ